MLEAYEIGRSFEQSSKLLCYGAIAVQRAVDRIITIGNKCFVDVALCILEVAVIDEVVERSLIELGSRHQICKEDGTVFRTHVIVTVC